ncbi:hypothetical protein NDU88_000787 [Pleurodeles waltl]|uniref:Uncharacterized protein n=1 Tax=Pleurodeles waltl TaxID=8319 RepID=A0AAV7S925_PLEWA|nr:hypothetical protein NDU88_000787 [Pleurodeles waltl]
MVLTVVLAYRLSLFYLLYAPDALFFCRLPCSSGNCLRPVSAHNTPFYRSLTRPLKGRDQFYTRLPPDALLFTDMPQGRKLNVVAGGVSRMLMVGEEKDEDRKYELAFTYDDAVNDTGKLHKN